MLFKPAFSLARNYKTKRTQLLTSHSGYQHIAVVAALKKKSLNISQCFGEHVKPAERRVEVDVFLNCRLVLIFDVWQMRELHCSSALLSHLSKTWLSAAEPMLFGYYFAFICFVQNCVWSHLHGRTPKLLHFSFLQAFVKSLKRPLTCEREKISCMLETPFSGISLTRWQAASLLRILLCLVQLCILSYCYHGINDSCSVQSNLCFCNEEIHYSPAELWGIVEAQKTQVFSTCLSWLSWCSCDCAD